MVSVVVRSLRHCSVSIRVVHLLLVVASTLTVLLMLILVVPRGHRPRGARAVRIAARHVRLHVKLMMMRFVVHARVVRLTTILLLMRVQSTIIVVVLSVSFWRILLSAILEVIALD